MARTSKFTVEYGIEVQERHLKEWKHRLKKNVYKALCNFARSKNEEATTGYDICRGSDLTQFIASF